MRLIDKEDLQERIWDLPMVTDADGFDYVSRGGLLNLVMEADEIEQEDIIYCQDCGRCSMNLLDDATDYWCPFFGREMEPDDWCSRAKPRKEKK